MRYLLSAAALLLCAGVLNAATIHVPADQPTIQAGIDAAVNGDTVLVAPGTYVENFYFSGKNIALIGEYGAGSTTLKPASLAQHHIEIVAGESSLAELRGFTIQDNQDYSAVFISGSSPTICYNVFFNNGFNGVSNQTPLRVQNAGTPDIHHNVFDNNGGVANVFITGSQVRFINNTIVNSSRSGIYPYDAGAVVKNNIVVGCPFYGIYDGGNGADIDYNDTWNNASFNYGGPNGITTDPLWVDPSAGNYTLQPTSPCIDAGDPDPQYNDPDGTRNDIGAFYYNPVYDGPVWYVSTTGDDSTGDGSLSNPFLTIQHAINQSNLGDTVLVSPGNYHERLFIGASVNVIAVAGSDSTAITADSTGRVITIVNSSDTVRIIEFEITGGASQGDTLGDWGAGILAYNAPVVIEGCDIHDNVATVESGGGICFREGAFAVLRNNFIHDNHAEDGGGIMSSLNSAGGVIEGNVVVHNTSDDAGGGVFLWNATNNGAQFMVSGNTISHNSSNRHGSGLQAYEVDLQVFRNIIAFNTAVDTGTVDTTDFGGLYLYNCMAEVDTNDVYGNFGNDYGGYAVPGSVDFSLDPQFCDTSVANFSLYNISPCAPANNSWGKLIGALDVDCDTILGPRAWYVSTTGDDVSGNGSPLNPFLTIQSAVDTSSAGDSVLVGPGTYTGDGNHDISTLGKALVIMGQGGSESTFMDGDSTHYGFTITDISWDVDSSTVIQGFSLLNCVRGIDLLKAFPLLDDLRLQNCVEGVWSNTGDNRLTLRNCHFISNEAGIRSRSLVLIEDCQFVDNSTSIVSYNGNLAIICRRSIFDSNGTGITCEQTPPTSGYNIDSCVFIGNGIAIKGECVLTNSTIRDGGEAIRSFTTTESITVDNCVFENLSERVLHSSTYMRVYNSIIRNNPGSVADVIPPLEGTAVLEMHNCQIIRNGGGINGGTWGWWVRVRLYNCEYTNNGGGILCKGHSSRLIVDSSTIASISGTALDFGGGYGQGTENSVTIRSSIIAGNSGYGLSLAEWTENVSLDISCNNFFANHSGDYDGIDDQTGLNGNISVDPLFCDTAAGDYHLYSTSPCTPYNDSCGVLMGALDIGCSVPPPVITMPTDTTITEMDSLTLTVTATSPDGQIPTLSAVGLPDSAGFTDQQDGTGSFDWQTDNFDEGAYEVTFLAVNPMDTTLRDSQAVTITVIDSNLTPMYLIDPEQETEVHEGDTLLYVILAFDPDSTIPTIALDTASIPDSAAFMLDYLTFTDSGNGVGVLEFFPDYSMAERPYWEPSFYYLSWIVTDAEEPFPSVTTHWCTFHVLPANPYLHQVFVDGSDPALNVIDDTPLIEWSYTDPLERRAQTQVELAVGTDDDWQYAEMWNPAPFQMPDTFVTYAGIELIDGETYYLRLRVHNSVAWSDWYETSFRMNSVPSVPVPLSPIDDAQTDNQPTLWVENSTDAEGDALTYDFFCCVDTSYGEPDPIYEYDIAESTDSTGWQVTEPLDENKRYGWIVRAYDGYEYSDWTASYEYMFFVDGTPEAPTAPETVFPPGPEGLPVFVMLPTFSWSESTDPDPLDIVRYKLEIAIDSNFVYVNTIDSLTAIMHSVTDSLMFGTRYWWRVTAFDNTGLSTMSPTAPDFWTWVPGDIDHSHTVDISDLVILVDYMFNGGPAPYPLFVADIDGSCGITISDLVYLVDFMFLGGPPPAVRCE